MSQKFAVYEGLEQGNRFFSSFNDDGEDCKLNDGTVAYKILFTADTMEKCQEFLHGTHRNVYNFTMKQKAVIAKGLQLLYECSPDDMEKMDAQALLFQITLT